MKLFKRLFLVLLTVSAHWVVTGHAQEKSPPSVPGFSVEHLADGEIRKVDRENKKITIKHGEIKHLDMPGMTMVFQIRDPALFEKLKAGDKVKFMAEKLEGAFVVTVLQPAK
jgi:Cu/Ag efflux protein CusF